LSGDRHFSSAYHVLERFVELSSGPFGSTNARLRYNKERFSGYDEGSLWMILDIDTSGAQPEVAYELWLGGGGLLERRELSWDQLHGRQPIALSPSPLQPTRWPARPKQA
jgi:alkaline phosphatase D